MQKQWQQECLSLTLEEIVHIRSVLTKAELESLPVEGRVKEDAEKGKVSALNPSRKLACSGVLFLELKEKKSVLKSN